MNKSIFFLAVLAQPLLAGCALFGGVSVDTVATSVQKPSNVALYMSISKDDEPIRTLTEKDFRIREDGQELSPEQTKQVLLPRDIAAVHRALLLVDMSGNIAEGDTRNNIAMAVARFVTRAHATQPVAVFAFDGAAAPRLIAEYPEGSESIGEIPALQNYEPTDPSSNLHGAVPEALAQLEVRLNVQKPIRIGTFVVFARGPDLAGRVTDQKMFEALSERKFLQFAIDIKGAPTFKATRIGKDGVFTAESPTSMLTAFDAAGARVASTVERHYLLSYCSPARAGKRRLKVEVVTKDEKDKEMTGSVSTEFDAAGFTSGCDPAQRPRFVVPKVADKADKPAATDEKPREEEKPKTDEKPKADAPAPAPGKPAAPKPQDDDSVAPPPSKPGYAQ